MYPGKKKSFSAFSLNNSTWITFVILPLVSETAGYAFVESLFGWNWLLCPKKKNFSDHTPVTSQHVYKKKLWWYVWTDLIHVHKIHFCSGYLDFSLIPGMNLYSNWAFQFILSRPDMNLSREK